MPADIQSQHASEMAARPELGRFATWHKLFETSYVITSSFQIGIWHSFDLLGLIMFLKKKKKWNDDAVKHINTVQRPFKGSYVTCRYRDIQRAAQAEMTSHALCFSPHHSPINNLWGTWHLFWSRGRKHIDTLTSLHTGAERTFALHKKSIHITQFLHQPTSFYVRALLCLLPHFTGYLKCEMSFKSCIGAWKTLGPVFHFMPVTQPLSAMWHLRQK